MLALCSGLGRIIAGFDGSKIRRLPVDIALPLGELSLISVSQFRGALQTTPRCIFIVLAMNRPTAMHFHLPAAPGLSRGGCKHNLWYSRDLLGVARSGG